MPLRPKPILFLYVEPVVTAQRNFWAVNSVTLSRIGQKWAEISQVSIATRHGLDGPGIECQCGARFSSHFQTGLEAQPASCAAGTMYFPEVKRPGLVVDHLSPSVAWVKESVEIYLPWLVLW